MIKLYGAEMPESITWEAVKIGYEKPLDTKWEKLELHKVLDKKRMWYIRIVCDCKTAKANRTYMEMDKYTTREGITYYFCQCRHCKTIYWAEG